MVKRYAAVESEASVAYIWPDENGKWVTYKDYENAWALYESKSMACEAQKNETAAYMRDYEREKARADRLQEILADKYNG